MSKINFLKPDKSNLNTFLYLGSFLFFVSVLDVLLNSFFSFNLTGFLPGFLSYFLPLILVPGKTSSFMNFTRFSSTLRLLILIFSILNSTTN